MCCRFLLTSFKKCSPEGCWCHPSFSRCRWPSPSLPPLRPALQHFRPACLRHPDDNKLLASLLRQQVHLFTSPPPPLRARAPAPLFLQPLLQSHPPQLELPWTFFCTSLGNVCRMSASNQACRWFSVLLHVHLSSFGTTRRKLPRLYVLEGLYHRTVVLFCTLFSMRNSFQYQSCGAEGSRCTSWHAVVHVRM